MARSAARASSARKHARVELGWRAWPRPGAHHDKRPNHYARPLHVALRCRRCPAASLKHLAYFRLEPNLSCLGIIPILNHDFSQEENWVLVRKEAGRELVVLPDRMSSLRWSTEQPQGRIDRASKPKPHVAGRLDPISKPRRRQRKLAGDRWIRVDLRPAVLTRGPAVLKSRDQRASTCCVLRARNFCLILPRLRGKDRRFCILSKATESIQRFRIS